MPIAWHQSIWQDWYVPKDEKKETEKLWAEIWAFFVSGDLIQKIFFDQKEIKRWPYTDTGKLIQ